MARRLTTEEFIEKAKKVHGDKYDYSLVNYLNNHAVVQIVCPIHGVFEQQPNNHMSKKGCVHCSYIKSNKNLLLIRIPYYEYNNIEKILNKYL